MDMDVDDPQVEGDGTTRGEVQAFLITDIRGYSTFTTQRGATAAAHLATTFTDLSRDAVAARGGKVLGLRGDEVLAAFSTAGQAVRAAVDIQFACAEATAAEPPIQLAASNVESIAFSPDGRLLAASLQSGDTIVWDIAAGQRMGTSFPFQYNAITAPLFTRSGDLVINYTGDAADWPTDLGSWERYACQVAGRDMTPTEWANVLPNRHYQHVCPP
jgi:hypothetical protein